MRSHRFLSELAHSATCLFHSEGCPFLRSASETAKYLLFFRKRLFRIFVFSKRNSAFSMYETVPVPEHARTDDRLRPYRSPFRAGCGQREKTASMCRLRSSKESVLPGRTAVPQVRRPNPKGGGGIRSRIVCTQYVRSGSCKENIQNMTTSTIKP